MEPVQSSAQISRLPLLLQGNAEEGDQATGDDRSTEFASETDGSAWSAGAGLGSTRGGGRARAGAAGGRRTAACAARARSLRRITGGLVTALLIAGLVASELLRRYLVGLVDATTVPEAAHLTWDGLLVIGHGRDGAVPALASERESILVALVASRSNFTLSSADLRAGVLLGLAPLGLCAVRHQVGVDGAAGLNGGRETRDGAVLGSNKAGEGRSGKDQSRVQHLGQR